MNKQELFNIIQKECKSRLTIEWIMSVKTIDGNTQSGEQKVINKIIEILDDMNISYIRAGSQQPKDFRNIGKIGLDIEIKKTNNTKIYFNDTCPSSDIYYIILHTSKKYPQVLYLNGSEFFEDCSWINEYQRELNILKDKYARGENKKKLSGVISVYPRPTYTADIRRFLQNY